MKMGYHVNCKIGDKLEHTSDFSHIIMPIFKIKLIY